MNLIFGKKYSLLLAIIPGLLLLPSVNASSFANKGKTTIAQSFEPPPEDPPREIQDIGGRPSDSCMPTADKYPIALIPENTSDRRNENREASMIPWGLTVSASPPLFVYIPETTVTEAEVQLWRQQPDNKRPKLIYRDRISLPDRPGIIQIDLPKDRKYLLETGQLYEWNLQILCDRFNRSQNPRTSGLIQRIEPRDISANESDNESENIQLENLYSRYASQGIWYDALANLVQERRSHPDDATLQDNWQELLTSVGLEYPIEKPILDCCKFSE